MTPSEVGTLVARIAAAVPDTMDREEVDRYLADLKRLDSWKSACVIAGTRRARELAAHASSPDPGSSLRIKGGLSDREARDATDREEAAGALPGFESALGAGEVATGHLDALSAARKMLAHEPELLDRFAEHEAELLGHAERDSVEAFRRRCRQLAKRLIAEADNAAPDKELERQRTRSRIRGWRDKSTGMHHFKIEIDPVRGSLIDRTLHNELRRLRAEQQAVGGAPTSYAELQVDAFVSAFSRTGEHATQVPEVVVHIDRDKLSGEVLEAGGLCETEDGVPLPVATVRRWACDALLLPAVMDSKGMVRDMGRGSRTVTPAQKKQLATMHSTCIGRDCTVPFHKCDIHHVRFWTRDRGPTDLDNLVPLCPREHDLVHTGGWTLTMTPDRVATWTRPDGTIFHRGPCNDRSSGAQDPAA